MYTLRGLTHVLQCSNRRAELLEEERVVNLSTAKVNDLDDVHVGDDDVLWLDVQVEDASRVEVVQTLEDLHDVAHHVILGVPEPETHPTASYRTPLMLHGRDLRRKKTTTDELIQNEQN